MVYMVYTTHKLVDFKGIGDRRSEFVPYICRICREVPYPRHWPLENPCDILQKKKQIPPYPIVSWSTHNSSCLSPWLLLVEFKICIVVVSIYKLYISHRYWLHPVLFIESAYCWFYSSYVLILTQIWYMIEGSLEVNSDNMERWKSSQQGEESEEKRSEERRCRCAKR